MRFVERRGSEEKTKSNCSKFMDRDPDGQPTGGLPPATSATSHSSSSFTHSLTLCARSSLSPLFDLTQRGLSLKAAGTFSNSDFQACSLSKYTMVALGVVSLHMQLVKVHKVTKCLLKPPVKEITIPTDLKLHNDMRAIERVEFDYQVAEKMSLFEIQDGKRKTVEGKELLHLVSNSVIEMIKLLETKGSKTF